MHNYNLVAIVKGCLEELDVWSSRVHHFTGVQVLGHHGSDAWYGSLRVHSGTPSRQYQNGWINVFVSLLSFALNIWLKLFAKVFFCRQHLDFFLIDSFLNWLAHWHRRVKNIGWANQNIGGQKVVKSDKCMGISQLLGVHVPELPPPKSMPMD